MDLIPHGWLMDGPRAVDLVMTAYQIHTIHLDDGSHGVHVIHGSVWIPPKPLGWIFQKISIHDPAGWILDHGPIPNPVPHLTRGASLCQTPSNSKAAFVAYVLEGSRSLTIIFSARRKIAFLNPVTILLSSSSTLRSEFHFLPNISSPALASITCNPWERLRNHPCWQSNRYPFSSDFNFPEGP
jgi:hypothetical protein